MKRSVFSPRDVRGSGTLCGQDCPWSTDLCLHHCPQTAGRVCVGFCLGSRSVPRISVCVPPPTPRRLNCCNCIICSIIHNMYLKSDTLIPVIYLQVQKCSATQFLYLSVSVTIILSAPWDSDRHAIKHVIAHREEPTSLLCRFFPSITVVCPSFF